MISWGELLLVAIVSAAYIGALICAIAQERERLEWQEKAMREVMRDER